MTTLEQVVSAVASHAAASGHFRSVNGHEPKNGPVEGPTCSVWVQRLRPALRASGAAVMSAVLELNVRIYLPMKQEPQDAIDPAILRATDYLIGAYVAGFTLGGVAMAVDIAGMEGTQVTADAGYVELGGTLFRVMTIVVPTIVNDLWVEAP